MALDFLFLFPLLFVLAWVVLFVRGQRRGLLISVLACSATMAAGYWSILQLRSSTAGIGILFLPATAAVSGALAVVFGRLRVDARPALRAFAWLCLFASVGVPIASVAGGIQTQIKNRDVDRQQVENGRRIDENRQRIAELIRANDARAEIVLDAEIEAHRRDRTFLIPALETSLVSEARLDQLTLDDDLGVVLMVARNPRTRSDTLDRIYRTSSYPFYFFQALAENRNTPVPVLRSIAGQPGPIDVKMLDQSLARNPSVPRDILDRISGSGDVYTLRNLLGNPALDCGLLRKAADRIGPSDRNEIRSTDEAIAALEARLCVAKR